MSHTFAPARSPLSQNKDVGIICCWSDCGCCSVRSDGGECCVFCPGNDGSLCCSTPTA